MMPGGDKNYWLKVVLVFVSIVLMLCYLIYWLIVSGTVDRLVH